MRIRFPRVFDECGHALRHRTLAAFNVPAKFPRPPKMFLRKKEHLDALGQLVKIFVQVPPPEDVHVPRLPEYFPARDVPFLVYHKPRMLRERIGERCGAREEEDLIEVGLE